jgi:hypothetical protein
VLVVRRFVDGRYSVRNLATADDVADPDGRAVLNFKQASAAAQALTVGAGSVAGPGFPLGMPCGPTGMIYGPAGPMLTTRIGRAFRGTPPTPP